MIDEPIEQLLETLGTILDFDDFQVNAIAHFEEFNITESSFIYNIASREILFLVSTKDSHIQEIEENLEFTFTDNVLQYTFKVVTPPVHDFTGLSKFTANLQLTEEL
jgi:hypothetical protein